MKLRVLSCRQQSDTRAPAWSHDSNTVYTKHSTIQNMLVGWWGNDSNEWVDYCAFNMERIFITFSEPPAAFIDDVQHVCLWQPLLLLRLSPRDRSVNSAPNLYPPYGRALHSSVDKIKSIVATEPWHSAACCYDPLWSPFLLYPHCILSRIGLMVRVNRLRLTADRRTVTEISARCHDGHSVMLRT